MSLKNIFKSNAGVPLISAITAFAGGYFMSRGNYYLGTAALAVSTVFLGVTCLIDNAKTRLIEETQTPAIDSIENIIESDPFSIGCILKAESLKAEDFKKFRAPDNSEAYYAFKDAEGVNESTLVVVYLWRNKTEVNNNIVILKSNGQVTYNGYFEDGRFDYETYGENILLSGLLEGKMQQQSFIERAKFALKAARFDAFNLSNSIEAAQRDNAIPQKDF